MLVYNVYLYTIPKLVRYGSWSFIINGLRSPFWCGTVRGQILKANGKSNGLVRFTLLTVRLKNGTGTVRYGTDTVTNSDPLLYISQFEHRYMPCDRSGSAIPHTNSYQLKNGLVKIYKLSVCNIIKE